MIFGIFVFAIVILVNLVRYVSYRAGGQMSSEISGKKGAERGLTGPEAGGRFGLH